MLTGTLGPTMLPTLAALERIVISYFSVAFLCSSTCSPSFTRCATRSSAFSLAYALAYEITGASPFGRARTFFFAVISFWIALTCLLSPLPSKSTAARAKQAHASHAETATHSSPTRCTWR
jgi:hypothetical protein